MNKTAQGMEVIDGYKILHDVNVGFIKFYLGEQESRPGNYKVWRQNPNDSKPEWEQPFDNENKAMHFLYEKAIEKSNEQRIRKDGLTGRKKIREMER